jgi:Bifunctional DNA primase/polymerase, N-terminal
MMMTPLPQLAKEIEGIATTNSRVGSMGKKTTSQNPARRSMLDLALDYIAINPGRFLFPIKARAKFPPLIKNNLADASNEPEQIKKWSRKWPGCNWGLAHKKSNVLVVDVDTKPGQVGQATFDRLEIVYGKFPKTEETRTPSGGRHLIYNGEHIFALGKNGFGEHIDSPLYTIIPGCQFHDGTSYELVRAGPTADAPQWFFDLLKSNAKTRVADVTEAAVELDKPENVAWAIDFLKEDAEPAIEGNNGDFQTLKIAMVLRDRGISLEKAFELMLEYYNERCVPPWEPDHLERKVGNAFAYASRCRAGGATAEADFKEDADFDPDTIKTLGKNGEESFVILHGMKFSVVRTPRPRRGKGRKARS